MMMRATIFRRNHDAACQPHAKRYIHTDIAAHGKSHVAFDAQCDLAAVVYGADDDPDRLFIDFADDLSRSGRRVVGVVQVGRSCQSESPVLGVVVLPGGDVVPLVEDLPCPRCGYSGLNCCSGASLHGLDQVLGWYECPAGLPP
jgi:hypothetical protein